MTSTRRQSRTRSTSILAVGAFAFTAFVHTSTAVASDESTVPAAPVVHERLRGEVGWEPRIDIGVGHQSGNVGKEPIDLIWISLKNSRSTRRAPSNVDHGHLVVVACENWKVTK